MAKRLQDNNIVTVSIENLNIKFEHKIAKAKYKQCLNVGS